MDITAEWRAIDKPNWIEVFVTLKLLCVRRKEEPPRVGTARQPIRHFDGFRYAVKMTYTAVGLTRPAAAYLSHIGAKQFVKRHRRLWFSTKQNGITADRQTIESACQWQRM